MAYNGFRNQRQNMYQRTVSQNSVSNQKPNVVVNQKVSETVSHKSSTNTVSTKSCGEAVSSKSCDDTGCNKTCSDTTNRSCNDSTQNSWQQSGNCNIELLEKALYHVRKAEECIENAMKRKDKCDR